MVVLMDDLPAWLQVLVAASTVVAGLAAALSAVFAMLAARASRQIGRDTKEALARSSKPDVATRVATQRDERGRRVAWGAEAVNNSHFPAADVTVEALLKDGRSFTKSVPWLVPAELVEGTVQPGTGCVAWIDTPYDPPLLVEMTVQFSDQNRHSRWWRKWIWTPDPGDPPLGYWQPQTEVEIS